MSADFDDAIEVRLARVRQGEAKALDELVALLYDRFRQRAHQRLGHERPSHSLAPSDLTSEAVLRMLTNDEFARAANRHQLFRAFARALRQVLIDHARRRNADKRGGGREREELDDLADDVRGSSQIELFALDESLKALAAEYPREAEALEMRFFGACELAEIAEALSVTLRTVERDCRFGLAWLREFLTTESVP